MTAVPAGKRRTLTLIASFLWLLIICVTARYIGGLPLGTLGVASLVLISYYSRPFVALLTAVIVGVFLAYGERILPPTINASPRTFASLLVIGLIMTVLSAEWVRRRSIERLLEAQSAATKDALTEMPNRRALLDYLNNAILENGRLAVVFGDLDGFKSVNDMYGHSTGDQVLAAVGKRLMHTLRQSDFVARIGGDEFAMVIKHVHSHDDFKNILDAVEHAFTQPFHIDDSQFSVGISIGCAIFPDDGRNANELLAVADTDMYQRKRAKKLI